jgi:hypothetical protein
MQPALTLLARAGYSARGLVYLTVGGLAGAAAIGAARQPSGAGDALKALFSQPFGIVLVAALACGLLCFGAWRLAQSVGDADRHGNSGKALAIRSGFFISGLIYFSMAASAVRLLLGYQVQDGDQKARDWTSWLMSFPLGLVLVGAIGLGLVGAALVFAYRAFKGDLTKRLDVPKENWVLSVGRIGFLGRALVFAIAGISLCIAAITADPAQARGLGQSLHVLQQQPFGSALFGFTAFGLAAFGFFQLVVARYRRIKTVRP